MEIDVFIEGRKVNLISLNQSVVEESNWYKWFNDEETTQYMQQHYFPNTKARQMSYFKNNIENANDRLQLGIYHKKKEVLIGVISLSSIDFINRSCEISGLIGEKEQRNFVDYLEACKLIIKHAFDSLNMNRVWGGSIIPEVKDIFCRMLKFQEEGIQREVLYKNGNYKDAYMISLLRKDYYQSTKE